MAQIGSVAILVKLMGGQQVLTELQDIRRQADALAAKPVEIKVNVAGVTKGQGQLPAELTKYQRAVEQQAAGFQRAINDAQQQQQAKILAGNVAFQNGLNVMAGGLARVSGIWENGLRGITRFSDGLIHAGQTAATFAYRLALIAAPIDILIAKSLQFSIQLEASLAKVATQLDGSVEHLREFISESRDLIIDLQSQYGVAGEQQAGALYYLVSSGVAEQTAKAALEPLARLAAVTQTPAEIASQALVASLNVFKEQLSTIPTDIDRVTYALEVMFDATRQGRFEFGDFAQQFGRAAEPMRMAGATFEDTAAALATLSQVFTPSQAATSLSSFANAIIAPTEKAKDALDKLYGSWEQFAYKTDATGKTVKKTFDEIFTDFFARIREIAKTDIIKADEILMDVFSGVRGGRGAQFFLDPANQDLFNRIRDSLGLGEDNLAKAWKITSEQIQTQINMVQGAFLRLGTTIADTMKPAILGGLESLKSLFAALASNPQVVNILASVGAAMAIIAPAALVFGTALMGIGGIVTALGTLMTPAYLIGFSILMKELAPVLSSAGDAVKSFGGGLNGLLALVVETARQLGILKDADVKNIFEKMGIAVTPESVSRVKEFVGELSKLGDDARAIATEIGKIAEAIGNLIDRIGRGEGILGKFATVASGALGALSKMGIGDRPEDIAGKLDLIIGGALLAKIGSVIVGALSKLNTAVMNVTAGQVNLLGAGGLASGLLSGVGGSAGGIGGALAGGLAGGGALAVVVTGIAAGVVAALALAFAYENYKQIMKGVEDAIQYERQKATYALTDEGKAGIPMPLSQGKTGLLDTYQQKLDLTGQILDSLKLGASNAASSLTNVATQGSNAANALNSVATQAGSFWSRLQSGMMGLLNDWAAAIRALTIPNYGLNFIPTTPEGYGDYARSTGLQARLEAQYGDIINFGKQEFERNVAAPLKNVGTAASKTASALEQAAQKILDTIKSLVKDALASTKVTEEDMAAAAAGTYQDKADEFARRARAVAEGTPPEQYGAKFQEQYALAQQKMPGAGAAEIAAAFEDRSLFAGMTTEEIEKMWNWDAIVGSVKAGIARIVGEFKLMKAAVAEVISQLSSEDLQGLAEAMGVEGTTEDVTNAIMQKLGGLKDQKVSTDFTATFGKDNESYKLVAQYVEWIQKIPKSIITEIGLKIADDFQEIANKIIDFLNSIPTQINVAINIGTNVEGGASGYLDIPQFTAPNNESGSGGGHGKAVGGYVENGLYRVGEQGREYVLPHGITTLLEGMLGGHITSPFDIFTLIGGGWQREDWRRRRDSDYEGGGSGSGRRGRWIMIQNAHFNVPNGATLEMLAQQVRNYAAHGLD